MKFYPISKIKRVNVDSNKLTDLEKNRQKIQPSIKILKNKNFSKKINRDFSEKLKKVNVNIFLFNFIMDSSV